MQAQVAEPDLVEKAQPIEKFAEEFTPDHLIAAASLLDRFPALCEELRSFFDRQAREFGDVPVLEEDRKRLRSQACARTVRTDDDRLEAPQGARSVLFPDVLQERNEPRPGTPVAPLDAALSALIAEADLVDPLARAVKQSMARLLAELVEACPRGRGERLQHLV